MVAYVGVSLERTQRWYHLHRPSHSRLRLPYDVWIRVPLSRRRNPRSYRCPYPVSLSPLSIIVHHHPVSGGFVGGTLFLLSIRFFLALHIDFYLTFSLSLPLLAISLSFSIVLSVVLMPRIVICVGPV